MTKIDFEQYSRVVLKLPNAISVKESSKQVNLDVIKTCKNDVDFVQLCKDIFL